MLNMWGACGLWDGDVTDNPCDRFGVRSFIGGREFFAATLSVSHSAASMSIFKATP